MKKILIAVLILLFSCGESEQSKEFKEIQKEMATPQYQEKKYPMNYIEFISYEQDMNFFGTKTEFEVIIKNVAKYTEYKNLHIKIDWLTNTGKKLTTWGHIDKKIYLPNHTYKIKFEKGSAPELAKKFSIRLESVEVERQIQ